MKLINRIASATLGLTLVASPALACHLRVGQYSMTAHGDAARGASGAYEVCVAHNNPNDTAICSASDPCTVVGVGDMHFSNAKAKVGRTINGTAQASGVGFGVAMHLELSGPKAGKVYSEDLHLEPTDMDANHETGAVLVPAANAFDVDLYYLGGGCNLIQPTDSEQDSVSSN